MPNKIIALVPAAGAGARLGESLPKQYLDLDGHPMIYHALAALAAVPRIERILVVLALGDACWHRYDWSRFGDRIEVAYCGGATRGESVLNGLDHLFPVMDSDDWVLVHDAARPCIRSAQIEGLITTLEHDAIGGLMAQPLADTVKASDEHRRVLRTVPRAGLWRAQTPQMFRFGMLRHALDTHSDATDESQAIEALGHAPKLVAGDSANLKVTYAADIDLARLLLRARAS
jgi:2-C-methyl-D-erythritol 4-phosphate cytidylyltransferase